MKYFIKTPVEEYLKNIRTGTLVKVSGDNYYKQPNYYTDGDIVTNLFTEEARMKSNIYGKPTPLEFWETNRHLVYKKAKQDYPALYHFNNDSSTGPNAEYLRESIYALCKESTLFSVALSKAIYDNYANGGSVFDPFGGWGDRMLGSLCSNITKYECCDVNSNLEQGYSQIKKYDVDNKITYHIGDTLQFLKEGKFTDKYDLVFTSPPYFDFEIYSKDAGQSIVGKNYQQWLDVFMSPLIKHLALLVKPGGKLAMHIGDTFRAATFVKDIKDTLDAVPTLTSDTVINCWSAKSRPVPILIYTRKQSE